MLTGGQIVHGRRNLAVNQSRGLMAVYSELPTRTPKSVARTQKPERIKKAAFTLLSEYVGRCCPIVASKTSARPQTKNRKKKRNLISKTEMLKEWKRNTKILRGIQPHE